MTKRRVVDLRCKGMTVLLSACIFFELGCAGPSIDRFQIEPQVLCDGQRAALSWDASGEPAMAFSLEPAPTGGSDCTARGRETFAFTLVARRRGKEAERKVEVVQLHESGAEPIAIRTSRLEGSDVVASGEKNPALWTQRVQIATVAACQNRAIQVQHAGKTVLLPAKGIPSDALAGTPLAGSWELRSPLSSDEQTNPGHRPKALEVLATFRCEKDAP